MKNKQENLYLWALAATEILWMEAQPVYDIDFHAIDRYRMWQGKEDWGRH